jgi:hypothetical protein
LPQSTEPSRRKWTISAALVSRRGLQLIITQGRDDMVPVHSCNLPYGTPGRNPGPSAWHRASAAKHCYVCYSGQWTSRASVDLMGFECLCPCDRITRIRNRFEPIAGSGKAVVAVRAGFPSIGPPGVRPNQFRLVFRMSAHCPRNLVGTSMPESSAPSNLQKSVSNRRANACQKC